MHPELGTLLLLMMVIAVLSISGAYTAYRLRLVRYLRSLRWALLVTMFLTVALIFLNVWVSAQLMFINEYDLAVTGALLVFAGVIALIFGFFVSSALTESIREMAKAAEQIAQGKLETRLRVEGNDELAEFARRFNDMVTSLQQVDEEKHRLDQQRRDLIAWSSHDLRTPVTAIRAMIEAMIDGVVTDPATTARYLHNMELEVQNMTRLIDNLLELAQLDAGHIKLDYQIISLRDLISDSLGSIRVRARQQGITVNGELDPKVDLVYIAPDKIQRVLSNLLDNALRYTPEGGQITLRAQRDRDSVRVSVQNNGAGMVALDLSQVFTRFYREEASRSRSQDGHRGAGLGLAITRGFVEAHGGKIWVESDPAQGVTFTFTLPLKPAPALP
ncbi:MAG: HAMP domain-containing protein [Anaerolineae bacterium]|nr:HAMP domain-containing protein [Anaerolineae bacterium]